MREGDRASGLALTIQIAAEPPPEVKSPSECFVARQLPALTRR